MITQENQTGKKPVEDLTYLSSRWNKSTMKELKFTQLWFRPLMSYCYLEKETCRGKILKPNNGPWAQYRVQPRPRRKRGAKRTFSPTLISPNLFKKRSEEECLLRRAKYGPNMHPIHNKESLQQILVVRTSLTKPGEGREYRMSRERSQLPH